MNGRTYYYARVSTNGQNLQRQLDAFAALGAEDWQIVTDKASGKDLARPGYTALKTVMLRSGDTLVIKSLDRLSRCKDDTVNELRWLKGNGIRLKVIDIPTTMVDFPEGQGWVLDMVTNILVEVLATIAEQERKTIKARQAEGNAAMPIGEDGKRHSLKTGRAVGRPALDFPEGWADVYGSWKAGTITAKTAMDTLGLKRTSFYKLVKMAEQ